MKEEKKTNPTIIAAIITATIALIVGFGKPLLENYLDNKNTFKTITNEQPKIEDGLNTQITNPIEKLPQEDNSQKEIEGTSFVKKDTVIITESKSIPSKATKTDEIKKNQNSTLSKNVKDKQTSPSKNLEYQNLDEGVWIFEAIYYAELDHNGVERKCDITLEFRIDFSVTGNKITGEMLWIDGKDYNPCGINTLILGSIEKDKLEFIIKTTGNCCNGTTDRFSGQIYNNKIYGKSEPEGLPSIDCTNGWCNFSAKKEG